jgi:hypothetical protein
MYFIIFVTLWLFFSDRYTLLLSHSWPVQLVESIQDLPKNNESFAIFYVLIVAELFLI